MTIHDAKVAILECSVQNKSSARGNSTPLRVCTYNNRNTGVTVYFIPRILYPGDSISLVQSIRGQGILSAQVSSSLRL